MTSRDLYKNRLHTLPLPFKMSHEASRFVTAILNKSGIYSGAMLEKLLILQNSFSSGLKKLIVQLV